MDKLDEYNIQYGSNSDLDTIILLKTMLSGYKCWFVESEFTEKTKVNYSFYCNLWSYSYVWV